MIFIECNADELLIKKLGFPRNKIRHEPGKGEVLNKLKKCHKGIGIIDEDPASAQPNQLKFYSIIESKNALTLMNKHGDENKKLIIISPRLEDWLINRSKVNNIKPSTFNNLPDNANELHRIPRIDKNKNFGLFLMKLIDIDEVFLTMKQWIKQSI